MELERKPQSGQIWRHFKGNTYRVLFCTGSQTTMEDWMKLPGVLGVKHSETLESVKAVLTIDHKIELLNVLGRVFPEPHVVYQQHSPDVFSMSDNPDYLQVWARPLDNFLEVISSPYIKGVVDNNYPRFARIG